VGSHRTPTTLAETLTTVGSTSSVANIIMQLSLPAVGEGVSESRVVSGSPRRRPVKRGRTTATYLALAIYGTDRDRARMRAAVAEVHRAVHSTPQSPVRYSGNSPDLQLWVAACLFRYFLDQWTTLYGDLDRSSLDRLTSAAAPLATGLNVSPAAWPSDWAAFEAYWERMLPHLSISEGVREDFEDLAAFNVVVEAWGLLGRPLRRVFGRSYHFITRANLPPYFRAMMGWDWTADDERQWQRIQRLQRLADRCGNRLVLRLFYRAHVLDFRLRARLGLPVLGRLQVSERMIRDGGGRPRLGWRRREAQPTAGMTHSSTVP
jgi:uncharacterized protein (DUF2236 family)